jgi:hypothetical protein
MLDTTPKQIRAAPAERVRLIEEETDRRELESLSSNRDEL